MILSRADLRELTGFARPVFQLAWLGEQGIPYKFDRTRVIVLSEHVTAWMENRPIRQYTEPDWSAVK